MKPVKCFLICSFLIFACSRESVEPEFALTPATQTGANTVSFMVDGRGWQPYGRTCATGGWCVEPLNVYYNPKRGQFQINAFLTTSKRSEYFSLECDSLFKSGAFVLSQGTINRLSNGGLYYAGQRLPGDPSYKTFDSTSTHITITRLDTVAHIISGVFDGYLLETTSQVKAVNITDGRFDVKY